MQGKMPKLAIKGSGPSIWKALILLIIGTGSFFANPVSSRAALEVATLHPMVTDLAREVGENM